MTTIILKIVGYADGRPCEWSGRFLRSMDFEAHDGRGLISATRDVKQAMRFKSAREAYEYWNTVSKTTPLRPDRKWNRPMTAFDMSVEPYCLPPVEPLALLAFGHNTSIAGGTDA